MASTEHDDYLTKVIGIPVAQLRASASGTPTAAAPPGGAAPAAPGAAPPGGNGHADEAEAHDAGEHGPATHDADAAPPAHGAHGAAKAAHGAHHEGGEKAEHGKKGEKEGEESPGVTISKEVELGKWKVPALGGKIHVEFSLSASLEATVGGEDGLGVSVSHDGIALAAANQLWESKKSMAIGGVDILSNPKLELEAAYKNQTAKLATKFSVDIPIGKVTLELVGLQYTPPQPVKLGSIGASLKSKPIKFAPITIKGVQLHNIELSVTGAAEVEGEYVKILLEEAGKKFGMAAGEAVAAAAGGEVVIAGSLVLVGVSVVVGGVLDLAQSSAISEVGDHRNMWRDKMLKGFRDGYIGLDKSGDDWTAYGYDVGSENFEKLYKAAKDKNPNATPQDIGKALGQKADKAVEQIRPEFDNLAGRAAWESFLKGNPKALAGVARNSYQAAFQKFPDDSDPEWKKWKDKQMLGGMI